MGLGSLESLSEKPTNKVARKIASVATIEENDISDSVNSRYSQEEVEDVEMDVENLGAKLQSEELKDGFDKTYSRCSEVYNKLAMDSSRHDQSQISGIDTKKVDKIMERETQNGRSSGGASYM